MRIILALVLITLGFQIQAMEYELGSNSLFSDRAVGERIAPVGHVVIADELVATQPTGPRSGEQIYNNSCVACHGSGILNAPKPGADWVERKAKGLDTLLKHAKEGFNAMPAMGTCSDCSDEELTAAIDYMINN